LTVAVLTGTAGVGKTALAVRWAHRVADRFPDGQLYVNLCWYDPDQPVRAEQALETFLRALGAAGPDIPHGLSERAARYRTLVADRRFLVLLDNANSVEQVRDLLPGTASCLVVVTSRDALPALVARHGAARITLDLLAPAEAHTLLRTLVGPRVDAEPAAVDTLARRCARLPLALRIAAELAAARPRATLATLVDELGAEPGRLNLLAAGGDDHTAVRAVFSWSLRHLAGSAASAFTMFGLHPGTDLDLAGVAALTGTDRATTHGFVDVLLRAHLLDEVGGDRVGMHDLLHAYAAERAGCLDEDARRAALDRLRRHYVATARSAVRLAFPGADMSPMDGPGPAARFDTAGAAMAWLDAERTNLVAVARAATDELGTIDLSTVLCPYLDTRAHYHDALVLHGLARAAARVTGDLDAEGRALTRLGTVHRRLGDFRAAIGHYEQALAIHGETGDRASLGVTLHQLGLAYWRMGRYRETVTCIEQALASYREAGDEGGTGAAEYGLGLARFQLGQYAAALDHHHRALVIFRRIGDRTGEGRTYNNIGVIEHRLDRPDAARDHYRHALQIARAVGNRTGEAVAQINLADLDVLAGDLEVARDRYARALALSRHTGYRVAEADALRGLGVVFGHLGRVDESVDHISTAVALCRDSGEYETQARALLDLADVMHRTGRPDEAVAHYRAALIRATEAGDLHTQARARDAIAVLAAVDNPATAGPRQRA
jgi:tetratricopeptide (TPR) repeat protein